MDKAKLAKIMNVSKAIMKKHGDDSVYSLGSPKSNAKIPRWSTGIESLDAILGGGMPEGRIIEIFGAESAGKTSLGHHLTAMHSVAVDIPVEGTFDAKQCKAFGNTKKQLIVFRPAHGEAALDGIMRYARAGVPIIILDSIPACLPKADFERVEKNNEKNGSFGGVARLMASHLPVITNIIEISGTTVILINQTRAKIGAVPFGPQYETPGGKAVRFYASIRLQVARIDWIEVPNKDPRNSAKNQRVGILQKIRVIKSKVCEPLGEVVVPFFFDRGYVSYDDIADIRAEIMQKNLERFKNNGFLG